MPYSRSSRMSGMCTMVRVRTVRVAALCGPSGIGNAPLIAVTPSGSTFVVAARWTSSPSTLRLYLPTWGLYVLIASCLNRLRVDRAHRHQCEENTDEQCLEVLEGLHLCPLLSCDTPLRC